MRTGVPCFIGLARSAVRHDDPEPTAVTNWPEFRRSFLVDEDRSHVAHALRGFFANGGRSCYVAPMMRADSVGLTDCLERMATRESIDLVCAPDLALMREPLEELQRLIVTHCDRKNRRFAILDAGSRSILDRWDALRPQVDGRNAALYFPWIRVRAFAGGAERLVPPCGHLAGVYARTDDGVGVHKAPANEPLRGALALAEAMAEREMGALNRRRVNCLRSSPGQGVMVWGARTLGGDLESGWVNSRRVFLAAVRWVEARMATAAFEPNAAGLWARIEAELTEYLLAQFRMGALRGATPEEAFYVRCDSELNPHDASERGEVAVEIGIAPAVPCEFVIVRLVVGERGVSVTAHEYPFHERA